MQVIPDTKNRLNATYCELISLIVRAPGLPFQPIEGPFLRESDAGNSKTFCFRYFATFTSVCAIVLQNRFCMIVLVFIVLVSIWAV